MSRIAAAFALACYLAGALVTPALHRLHHARFGEDHVHGPRGVHLQHAAFDADSVALDLGDVASAGTIAVDCALASYTLVSCDGADVIGHAPNFGDELLARATHSHAPPAPDPQHGRGADEHVTPALLVAAPIALPTPPRAYEPVTVAAIAAAPPCPAARVHSARGPPPTNAT